MKNLKTNWDIMYQEKINSSWLIFKTVFCIDPKKTKEYKQLEKKLINNQVNKILCEISLPF